LGHTVVLHYSSLHKIFKIDNPWQL